MEGGSLQPYAEGLAQYAAPELAIVLLFVAVSAMLAALVIRHLLALIRAPARRNPRKPEE